MGKTVADASRDYRQRQRAKLAAFERALRVISDSSLDAVARQIANDALAGETV